MKPKKILLDQYHLDLLDQYHLNIYVRPTCTLSKQEKQKLKRLVKRYLGLLAFAITGELDNKIKAEISQ